MPHTLKILDIGVRNHPEGQMVVAEVEINDGEKTVLRKFGYSLGITEEAVAADLKNVVACLDSDAEQQIRIAENEKAMAEVEKMKSQLEGVTFGGIAA